MIWLDALTALDRADEAGVLVTVVTARGSTPREAGCKMVVTATAQHDTIGGGNLEFTCVTAARAILGGEGEPVLRSFPLGPGLGQCCGGHVTVLFEPIGSARPPVAVFGAGHVGRAVAAVLAGLAMRVTLIDTRPEALADAPAGVRVCLTADPARAVAALPGGRFVLVMTHDHQLDFDIVAAALPRTDLAAVGLIGSATKRARFLARLRRIGLSDTALDRLICPIGLAGVGGKRPAEIAIAVAAQLLARQLNPRPRPEPIIELACGAACTRTEVMA